MNISLKKEIVSHILTLFGYNLSKNVQPMVNILDDNYRINKDILAEDNEVMGNIFCIFAKIENSELKVISSLLDKEECILLVQLDDLAPCAMQFSYIPEANDTCSLSILMDKDWIETGTAHQAKLLSTIEGLSSIFVQWEKMNKYEKMYGHLMSYLKYNEAR